MSSIPTPLKVAIVGAGPGGLAAAIQFSQLTDVEVSVFEAARELREVGAGISLNENTWRLLALYGAAQHLPESTAQRDGNVLEGQHRNGRTGAILSSRNQNTSVFGPPHARIERYKLQQALLKQVPVGLIQLNKRLNKIEESGNGTIVHFQDETSAGPYDLVIGADGIRSVVRQHIYPDHHLSYTGKIAYRVVIPASLVAHIPDIPPAPTFWHTPSTHVFTAPLPNDKFEIATRALESEDLGEKVSWGQVASKEQVVKHYPGYNDTIRKIIEAPEEWLQFAIFGGPRIDSVVHHGRIALIGDASHPLSGAFGSGAAFALEDAYTLKSAVEYARNTRKSLKYALELYDSTRSPHYKNLYGVLDGNGAVDKELKAIEPPLSDDELVAERVRRSWATGESGWMYKHNIVDVWAKRVQEEDLITIQERVQQAVLKSRVEGPNTRIVAAV